jgi:hypothetical protein
MIEADLFEKPDLIIVFTETGQGEGEICSSLMKCTHLIHYGDILQKSTHYHAAVPGIWTLSFFHMKQHQEHRCEYVHQCAPGQTH